MVECLAGLGGLLGYWLGCWVRLLMEVFCSILERRWRWWWYHDILGRNFNQRITCRSHIFTQPQMALALGSIVATSWKRWLGAPWSRTATWRPWMPFCFVWSDIYAVKVSLCFFLQWFVPTMDVSHEVEMQTLHWKQCTIVLESQLDWMHYKHGGCKVKNRSCFRVTRFSRGFLRGFVNPKHW